MQAVDLLPLERRLEGEVEVRERLHGREPRGTHRGLEPAVVAERDLRAQEALDGHRRVEAAAVEGAEDLVQGLERAGHFQVGELGADLFTQGGRGGFHALTSAPASRVSSV